MRGQHTRNQRLLGLLAQELAARYLAESFGWRVVARNVRVGRGEVDLVAQEGAHKWHAIEVKGAAGEVGADGRIVRMPVVPPLAHLTPTQCARVARVAREWLSRQGYRVASLCVDACVVIVDEQSSRARVEVLRGLIGGRGGSERV